MSVYSTRYISREEAEKMVILCRVKDIGLEGKIKAMPNEVLDNELHKYVYSRKNYHDIVGVCENYIIEKNND